MSCQAAPVPAFKVLTLSPLMLPQTKNSSFFVNLCHFFFVAQTHLLAQRDTAPAGAQATMTLAHRKKSRVSFFLRPVVVEKKNDPRFSLPPAMRQDMTFLLRRWKVWQSLNRTLLSAACQLPSYTENPEAALEGQCIFLLDWIGHPILPSCWHSYSDIFSRLWSWIPAI